MRRFGKAIRSAVPANRTSLLPRPKSSRTALAAALVLSLVLVAMLGAFFRADDTRHHLAIDPKSEKHPAGDAPADRPPPAAANAHAANPTQDRPPAADAEKPAEKEKPADKPADQTPAAPSDADKPHADNDPPTHNTSTSSTPAENPLTALFDHVYIVTVKGCEHRAQIIKGFAEAAGFRPEIFFGKHFQDIDLHNPPIPIRDIPDGNVVAAGQVGCTTTHNMLWQDIIDKNYSRVMVFEDDVFMTNDTLAILPQIMENVDTASRDKNIPWHYLFFRRSPLYYTKGEEVWAPSPSGHPITRAVPSWGTACYAMSAAGARFLRDRVNFYQHPLDVQISELQKSDKDFVTLSACFHDAFRGNCPENVFELSGEQKGKCAFSGTQAGQRLDANQFPKTH